MSIKDLTITDQTVQGIYVQSQPDRLTGTAQQNKAVFDAYPALLKQRFNQLLELLTAETGAGEIPVGPIDGVTAQNVQQALEAIQQNLTAYFNKLKAATGAVEVGVSTISGISAGNAQQALEGLRAIQITLDSNIQKLMSTNGAAAVGVSTISGMQAQNVQKALEELRQAIDDSISGIIPGGSIKPDMIDGPIPIKKGGTEADTAQKAIAFLGAGVRPNFLINSFFLINQQGKATYGEKPAYTVDMWRIYSSYANIDVLDDGIRIRSNTVNGYGGIEQILNTDIVSYLSGKTLTLSVFARPYVNFKLAGKVVNSGASDKFAIYSTTFVADKSNYVVIDTKDAVSLGGNIIDLKACKLELGDKQTLGYQDSNGLWNLLPQPESDYATQLAKCEQYFFPIENSRDLYGSVSGAGDKLLFTIDLPVCMRTIPAISGQSTMYVRSIKGQYGDFNPSNLRIYSMDKNQIKFECSNPDPVNIPPGTPITAFFVDNIYLTAEL